jgi:hypothetical protein
MMIFVILPAVSGPFRNITISSVNSSSNDSSTYALVDLDYVQSAADLCSFCTVHFRHIAIGKERRGSGAQLDFFTGNPPGSLLLLTDVYRVRQACTTPATARQITDATPPSLRAAGLEPAQQVSPGPAVWRGELSANQLKLNKWSADIPLVQEEGGRRIGGYSVVGY